jgi:hypothetical protein
MKHQRRDILIHVVLIALVAMTLMPFLFCGEQLISDEFGVEPFVFRCAAGADAGGGVYVV